MGAITVDSLSARTLPALDKIFWDNDLQKLEDLIMATEEAPLRRLTIASIARHTLLPDGVKEPGVEQILNNLITFNLTMASNDPEPIIGSLVDSLGKNGQRQLLAASISVFNIRENVPAGMAFLD